MVESDGNDPPLLGSDGRPYRFHLASRIPPLSLFTALGGLAKAKGSWVGTALPARIAGVIQRLTDSNYPLRPDQAKALLEILDTLIDLGDRRSAALEQAEAFRGVQVG